MERSPDGKDISVAEMRLLVTAVISFNAEEIVAAILNVDKIRNALLRQFFKQSDRFGKEFGIEHASSNADRFPEHLLSDVLTNGRDEQENPRVQLPSRSVSGSLDLQINGSLANSLRAAQDSPRFITNTDNELTNQNKAISNIVNTSNVLLANTTDDAGSSRFDRNSALSSPTQSSPLGFSEMMPQYDSCSQRAEKKPTKIDELLRKHVEANNSSFNVFNQVTQAVANCSKPLNLCIPQRSRKRKNTSPKHVSLRPEESPDKTREVQEDHYLPVTSHPKPQDTDNDPSLNVSIIQPLATSSTDPTLCGPFITPHPLPTTNVALFDEDTENSLQPSMSLDMPEAMLVSDLADLEQSIATAPCKIETASSETPVVKKKPVTSVRNENNTNNEQKYLKSKKSTNSSNVDKKPVDRSSETQNSQLPSLRLRCRRCNERFTTKADYQQHLQSQVCSTSYTLTHTCQICGYCALTRQRLIVHLRTHSGERPHRCPFCSYAATQQAPLKRHIQNIHMKQGAISLSS